MVDKMVKEKVESYDEHFIGEGNEELNAKVREL